MLRRRCGAFLTITVVLVLVFTSGARGERITEHYPSGDIKGPAEIHRLSSSALTEKLTVL